ncbi:hypothetical protein DFH09DRAFT_914485, partial [Mycena vulgaris]
DHPSSESFPYSAEVSFEFPLPSQTLLLLSQGELSAGDLLVTTSSAVNTGTARVHITVNYHKNTVRDAARVSVIKRNADESGVGIFTPTNWSSHTGTDSLKFNVILTLPQGAASALWINNLTTDVSNFSHELDSLKDVVKFGEISLRGSNGPISVKHFVALSASLRSSNGPISGNYHVSDSLDIRTSNGPVKVAVDINSGDSNASNTLTIRTSNGAVESIINLGTSSGTGGNFRVKTDNSNGPLTTQVVSCPVDGVLSLEAKTSNSPASVTLPPTYEGGFTLTTSNAGADVRRLAPNEQDPAGQGRQRVLEMKKATGSKSAGAVYWDKKHIHRGGVTLKSSNGSVSIHL